MTWSYEDLDIHINNTVVPTINNPKILCVTFDSMFTYNKHAKDVKCKVQRKNNILKSIAGSSWGKDKETILTTYKAISRPHINYAAPI